MRVLVVALALLAPATAVAQSTFYEAYERGMELQEVGRHEEARQAYLTAAGLHPEPENRIKTYGLNFLRQYDPYLRLAQVEIELGLLDQAQTHLGRSAEAGVSSSAEIEDLRTALSEALENRRSAGAVSPTPPDREPTPTSLEQPTPTPAPTRLQIESTPEGAEVFVDGLLHGITPVRIPVEPGGHRVELRIGGHQPQVHDLSIKGGSTEILSVQLNPVQLPTRPAAPVETNEPVVPTAAASSPTPSPTMTPTAPVPPEESVSEAVDDPLGNFPVWVLALVFVVVSLGMVVWFSRKLRQRARAPANPPHLTSELTIDVPSGFRLPESQPPAFGGFGEYKLRKVLGRGGMATTYLADRTRDNRTVALKIPHEHLLHMPEFVKRFVREGSLGATIHHPNIVRIYEVGQVGNHPFIAMEFIQGNTLSEFLQEQGSMAVRPALEVTRGIALALDYSHVKGIVHRDLKPANVMILPDGSVKVMDFGLAHIADAPGLTATNQYMGTPLYSPPEAMTPAEVDHRSDLYSLGIILHTMLSGRPPFEADSPLRLLEMHRDQSMPAFDAEFEVPVRVQELVNRLTAKEKSDRPSSAEELLAELNAILNDI